MAWYLVFWSASRPTQAHPRRRLLPFRTHREVRGAPRCLGSSVESRMERAVSYNLHPRTHEASAMLVAHKLAVVEIVGCDKMRDEGGEVVVLERDGFLGKSEVECGSHLLKNPPDNDPELRQTRLRKRLASHAISPAARGGLDRISAKRQPGDE